MTVLVTIRVPDEMHRDWLEQAGGKGKLAAWIRERCGSRQEKKLYPKRALSLPPVDVEVGWREEGQPILFLPQPRRPRWWRR